MGSDWTTGNEAARRASSRMAARHDACYWPDRHAGVAPCGHRQLKHGCPRASGALQGGHERRQGPGHPAAAADGPSGALASHGARWSTTPRTTRPQRAFIQSGPRRLVAAGCAARGPGRPEGVGPGTRRADRWRLTDGRGGTPRAGFRGCPLRSLRYAPVASPEKPGFSAAAPSRPRARRAWRCRAAVR
jgi:hypothetical protein